MGRATWQVPRVRALPGCRAHEVRLVGEVAAVDPADVAAAVVDGIRSGRFYILTSANRNEAIRRRGEEIIAGGPPAAPFP